MTNHPNRSNGASQSVPHPTLGRVNYRDVRATIAQWRGNTEFESRARKFLGLHHATAISVSNTGAMYYGASETDVPRERLAELLAWMEQVDPGRVPTPTVYDGVTFYDTQAHAEAALVRSGYRLITGSTYFTWYNDSSGLHGYIAPANIFGRPAFAACKSYAAGDAAGLSRLKELPPEKL